MERVPQGATLDPAVADEIASDADRATQALDHWRTVLETLAPTRSDVGPEIFRVLRAIPHSAMDRSPDPTISRQHLLAERDRAPGSGLVGLSGCCVSGAELAPSSGRAATSTICSAPSARSNGAAKGAPPRKNAGIGVRACRELHDAVRRVDTARLSATPGRVTRAEALALHRQEGAFAVTPDARSYPHAPLTTTRPNTCRISDVTFAQRGRRRDEPAGLQPRVPHAAAQRGDASAAPEVIRMEVLLVNAVVLGGLDILTSTRAAPSAPGDELAALAGAALAPGGPLGKDSTIALFADAPMLATFVTGMTMIELETRAAAPRGSRGVLRGGEAAPEPARRGAQLRGAPPDRRRHRRHESRRRGAGRPRDPPPPGRLVRLALRPRHAATVAGAQSRRRRPARVHAVRELPPLQPRRPFVHDDVCCARRCGCARSSSAGSDETRRAGRASCRSGCARAGARRASDRSSRCSAPCANGSSSASPTSTPGRRQG